MVAKETAAAVIREILRENDLDDLIDDHDEVDGETGDNRDGETGDNRDGETGDNREDTKAKAMVDMATQLDEISCHSGSVHSTGLSIEEYFHENEGQGQVDDFLDHPYESQGEIDDFLDRPPEDDAPHDPAEGQGQVHLSQGHLECQEDCAQVNRGDQGQIDDFLDEVDHEVAATTKDDDNNSGVYLECISVYPRYCRSLHSVFSKNCFIIFRYFRWFLWCSLVVVGVLYIIVSFNHINIFELNLCCAQIDFCHQDSKSVYWYLF